MPLIIVPATAEYGEILIDSTNFLNAQSLEISPVIGNNFTPFFTPGLITITSSTDVDDLEGSLLPSVFTLHQNYPNPFNPSTNISFDLPRASAVRIDVFNITGQKVTTLIEDYLGAGSHTVTFDGSKLASGVYHYRLIAGDHTESKKMILVK